MIANFVGSMMISFSLAYLWGLINCLQMIVYLPLFNVIFPGNINMVLSILINLATFDVIPFVDEIQEFFFRFEYINDVND